MTTALLVDDDPVFRAEVQSRLSREGFRVSEATTGDEALRLVSTSTFDLVVLEWNLAGLDGAALCRRIRTDSVNRGCGILFASARSSEDDAVEAFASGADDYVAKPVGLNEFVARARAVLRRSRYTVCDGARPAVDDARSPQMTIDTARRRVVIRGAEVALTRQEFDLLNILASHAGIVFSRQALLARLPRTQTGVTERTIDAIVTRLRQKLGEDPRNPQFIFTAWGLGYKFADVGED